MRSRELSLHVHYMYALYITFKLSSQIFRCTDLSYSPTNQFSLLQLSFIPFIVQEKANFKMQKVTSQQPNDEANNKNNQD